jgi:general stress protein 26
MPISRRNLIIAASLGGLGILTGAIGEERDNNLYRTASSDVILAATKALITSDTIGTLIAVDANGQPRARSILVSAPDNDLTLWMGTRKGSRKLEQISANQHATLHFADDSKSSYLSLMGEARAVFDPAIVTLKNPYKGKALEKFFPTFPTFPDDFVLVSFKPHYLEIMTGELSGKPDTWQPQGLMT